MDYLQELSNWIIVIAGVCVAVVNIYNFFATPAKRLSSKRNQFIKQQIQEAIAEHDKNIWNRYLKERDDSYKDLRNQIFEEGSATLEEIKQINLNQNEEILKQNIELKRQGENIDRLYATSKDVLRQRIMAIYHGHKFERRMPRHDKEALDELYKDYKAEGGNSYIDKYYGRMKEWEVFDEELENRLF